MATRTKASTKVCQGRRALSLPVRIYGWPWHKTSAVASSCRKAAEAAVNVAIMIVIVCNAAFADVPDLTSAAAAQARRDEASREYLDALKELAVAQQTLAIAVEKAERVARREHEEAMAIAKQLTEQRP